MHLHEYKNMFSKKHDDIFGHLFEMWLKEFNPISTTMVVFASLPFKIMPKKSNQDFKENYSYIRAGTLEPRRIKDVFTKNWVFCHMAAF